MHAEGFTHADHYLIVHNGNTCIWNQVHFVTIFYCCTFWSNHVTNEKFNQVMTTTKLRYKYNVMLFKLFFVCIIMITNWCNIINNMICTYDLFSYWFVCFFKSQLWHSSIGNYHQMAIKTPLLKKKYLIHVLHYCCVLDLLVFMYRYIYCNRAVMKGCNP